jgi:hypothetical protein
MQLLFQSEVYERRIAWHYLVDECYIGRRRHKLNAILVHLLTSYVICVQQNKSLELAPAKRASQSSLEQTTFEHDPCIYLPTTVGYTISTASKTSSEKLYSFKDDLIPIIRHGHSNV